MQHDWFLSRLGDVQREVDDLIEAHLAARPGASPRLAAAMRHAVLAGGKRLRPFLVLASAEIFEAPRPQALRVAMALEFLHCYSLAHDDLPAMDNDDLRRGQPTTHIAYDEATAILAGDALLTEAFAILADPATSPSPAVRADLVSALAQAAGHLGMVSGQMLDLAAEGRFETGEANGKPLALDPQAVRHLQSLKTGALLVFACEAGFRLAGRSRKSQRRALARYGAAFGLAFQLKDDLLDVEGDAALLGKAARKDAEAGKATLVGLAGVKRARKQLEQVTGDALKALKIFGNKAALLVGLAEYNRDRTH